MKLPRNCCLCVCLNLVIIVEQCELKKKREQGEKNSFSSLESTAGDLNNLSVVVIQVVSNATFDDGHKFKRRKIKNNKTLTKRKGHFHGSLLSAAAAAGPYGGQQQHNHTPEKKGPSHTHVAGHARKEQRLFSSSFLFLCLELERRTHYTVCARQFFFLKYYFFFFFPPFVKMEKKKKKSVVKQREAIHISLT